MNADTVMLEDEKTDSEDVKDISSEEGGEEINIFRARSCAHASYEIWYK